MIIRRADRGIMRKHLSVDGAAVPVDPFGIGPRKRRVAAKKKAAETTLKLHAKLTRTPVSGGR